LPYEKEYSCRLHSPDGFEPDSFRRIHQGKLDIIIGKLKSEAATTAQSFRYDKTKWTLNEARQHCLNHKGQFEASDLNPDVGFKFSFVAGITSLNKKAHTAKFYLLNTSRNRNNWGVTEKSLTEALPTITKVALNTGPDYQTSHPKGHFPSSEVMAVGHFTAYEQPQPSYALATAKICDEIAWSMMQKGQLGPVSVVIHAFHVSCSSCQTELKITDDPQEHKCIKEGSGYEQINSFVFSRVDFVDVPAYPQAGLLEMHAHGERQEVPIELLAAFYVNHLSCVQPQLGLNQKNKEKEKKKMSEDQDKSVADLQTENQALKEKLTELQAALTDLKKQSQAEVEASVELKKVREELETLKAAAHQQLVEEAYIERVQAGIADKPEVDKAYLHGFTDIQLRKLVAEAKKFASMLQSAKAAPKLRYEASENEKTAMLTAENEARLRLGLPTKKLESD